MKSLAAGLFFVAILLAPVSVKAEARIDSGFVLKAGVTCKLQRGKLICATTNDDQDDNEDEDDGDSPAAFSCAKARCEPGMVVLEKPNKYNACCEAREGLPAPKTAEPEKCKFPGEIGNPPNCSCPPGTEFMGYKGCVETRTVANVIACPPREKMIKFQGHWICKGQQSDGSSLCTQAVVRGKQLVYEQFTGC